MVLKTINPIKLSGETPFNLYEDIVKNKKDKNTLYGISNSEGKVEYSSLYKRVKEKYLEYDSLLPSSLADLVVESFKIEEKKLLTSCYTKPTKALIRLKENIINSQNYRFKKKCAYCGIGEISSMDHYAPKNKFPELSVHPLNLIPCCTICNSKKLEFFTLDSKLIFFNPYFDLEIKSLKMILTRENGSKIFFPKIEIINHKYDEHIARLDIIKRYESYSIEILTDILSDLSISFKEWVTENEYPVTNFLNIQNKIFSKKLIKLTNEKGINSIEALIYEALLVLISSDKDFFLNILE
ncbi:HNH endonuclease [Lactococcus lactis]|uniref:HNH endonuclease n=1 Tax=Lactococcus lactis TaxID=1358 RepID=UPI0025A253CC|nr:hypothetical protein [Lactococcus lactis]MDM7502028.1 hypothetical protein [Lactococcus lactis]